MTDLQIKYFSYGKKVSIFLIFLIPISKLSLNLIPGVPFSFPYLIYQWGIHPYFNFFLNGALFIPLFYIWNQLRMDTQAHPFWKGFTALLISFFALQSLMQMFFLDLEIKSWIHIASFSSTCILVLMFGRMIPELLPLDAFLKSSRIFLLSFVALSILLWLIQPEISYRGGRFIGAFKHIPHMVSCASIAFCFFLPKVLNSDKNDTLPIHLTRVALLSACFWTIWLTGTRSALISSLLALAIGFFIFPEKKKSNRYLQWSGVLSIFLFLLFFGYSTYDFGAAIVSGEKSLAQREAQNGLESRTDEIFRGLDLFQKAPWIGHGLSFKYQNTDRSIDVGGYNSFRDPHNYFVSAAVIGGWPLVIIVTFGILVLLLRIQRVLKHGEINQKTVALYLLTQIPILMIYHQHFSLGGVADRFYWLSIGYLALTIPSEDISKLEQE